MGWSKIHILKNRTSKIHVPKTNASEIHSPEALPSQTGISSSQSHLSDSPADSGSDGKIVLHLDRLMIDRKIPLNELAEKVGITPANLSKIKNNHITAMRFSTLIALCEALDCQVGDLLEYQPPQNS